MGGGSGVVGDLLQLDCLQVADMFVRECRIPQMVLGSGELCRETSDHDPNSTRATDTTRPCEDRFRNLTRKCESKMTGSAKVRRNDSARQWTCAAWEGLLQIAVRWRESGTYPGRRCRRRDGDGSGRI